MYVLLILIIIGFTIPGILNSEEEQSISPRVCQTDADCYLVCKNQPVAVLCSQNLCQQNSCDQKNEYNYTQTATSIKLIIDINNQKLNLNNRSNKNNFFITFYDDKVDLYSRTLSLNQILEKINLRIDSQCLTIDTTKYCSEGNKTIKMIINGTEQFPNGAYIPQNQESIELKYI